MTIAIIGSNHIDIDESMASADPEAIRQMLLAAHPEIKRADIYAKRKNDGTRIIEFRPKPGRKG